MLSVPANVAALLAAKPGRVFMADLFTFQTVTSCSTMTSRAICCRASAGTCSSVQDAAAAARTTRFRGWWVPIAPATRCTRHWGRRRGTLRKARSASPAVCFPESPTSLKRTRRAARSIRHIRCWRHLLRAIPLRSIPAVTRHSRRVRRSSGTRRLLATRRSFVDSPSFRIPYLRTDTKTAGSYPAVLVPFTSPYQEASVRGQSSATHALCNRPRVQSESLQVTSVPDLARRIPSHRSESVRLDVRRLGRYGASAGSPDGSLRQHRFDGKRFSR